MRSTTFWPLFLALVVPSLARAQQQQPPPPPPQEDDGPVIILDEGEGELGFTFESEGERPAVETRLDEYLYLDAPQMSLVQMAAHLRETLRLNLVLDPEADGSRVVTLAAQDEEGTVRRTLDSMVEQSGLQMRVWAGVVYVQRPGTELGRAPNLAAGCEQLRTPISCDLRQVPLSQALEELEQQSGASIDLAQAPSDVLVSLSVVDLPAGDALSLLTHPLGLTWSPTEDGARIERRRQEPVTLEPIDRRGVQAQRLAARVSLELSEASLERVASALVQAGGLPVRVEQGAPKDARVTLSLQDIALNEALDVIAHMSGARWSLEQGVIVLRRAQ